MNKFFENKTNSPIYVAGVMIPPGEGVLVLVPDEPLTAVATAAVPTLAEQVALLLKDSVKAITASIANLNNDTLEMAAALEGAGEKPRTSLLAAIAQEQLSRANALLNGDPDEEARSAALLTAQNDLAAAQAALDASADTNDHPALEAAVAEARGRIDVLAGAPAQQPA